MQNSTSTYVILLVAISMLLAGCDTRTPYQKLVDEELATGVRNDSLFLDISFGMTSQDFYDHCFALNKKGLIKEGMGNTSVRYEPAEFDSAVAMYFYPEFNPQTKGIRNMPIMLTYKAWAPWNQQYKPDSLLPEVMDMFVDWYGGNEFIEVTHPNKGSVFVKVDGNRRIRAFVKDLQYVQVFINDLTQPEEE